MSLQADRFLGPNESLEYFLSQIKNIFFMLSFKRDDKTDI